MTKVFLRQTSQWLHKWLALFVGIQVVLWMVGGAVFALVPFDAWVKSGEMVRKAPKPAESTTLYPLADIAARHAPLRSIELVGQGTQFYYRLTDAGGQKKLVNAADGVPLPAPDEAGIRTLGRQVYAGDAAIASVRWITTPEPRRLGLVDESQGKVNIWQVTFADRFSTRLYFSPAGEFLRSRNDAWVLYDFFWRLHIMDYGDGEDFNNLFLRILSPLALVLVLSGVVLLFFTRFRALPRRTAVRRD